MQPAAEVGGDYYDVIELGDGRLAFVVADVAGKGLPAALLMTLLRQPSEPAVGRAPGYGARQRIEHAPRRQHAGQPDDHVLLWRAGPCFGTVDLRQRRHNPPYLYGGDRPQTLDSTATVLGMIDGMPFPEASVDLRAARGCCSTLTASRGRKQDW